MAAFIPSRRDPEVNEKAMAKVREDKQREADARLRRFLVAHPDLVPICREVFDAVLGDRPNQLDRTRDEVKVSAAELLDVAATPGGPPRPGCATRSASGCSTSSPGCGATGPPDQHLMEDAATAEISRSQVWQWCTARSSLPRAPRSPTRWSAR